MIWKYKNATYVKNNNTEAARENPTSPFKVSALVQVSMVGNSTPMTPSANNEQLTWEDTVL